LTKALALTLQGPRLHYRRLVLNLRPSAASADCQIFDFPADTFLLRRQEHSRMGTILIDSSGHVLTAPFKANFEPFVSSEE
jgi:hypothetical protein